jgi:hypothetical protein
MHFSIGIGSWWRSWPRFELWLIYDDTHVDQDETRAVRDGGAALSARRRVAPTTNRTAEPADQAVNRGTSGADYIAGKPSHDDVRYFRSVVKP